MTDDELDALLNDDERPKNSDASVDEDDEVVFDATESDGEEDVAGIIAMAKLTGKLIKIVNQWREADIDDLIKDTDAINYKLNKTEMMALCNFIVPTEPAQIVEALEVIIAYWYRLGSHLENVSDLEMGAINDLNAVKAEAFPSAEVKRDLKLTEDDRKNAVERAAISQQETLRKLKKAKRKLILLLSCMKEYVNVAKKLLEYHVSGKSTMNN